LTREQESVIIGKVLSGNIDAFEDLVLEYQKNIYNLALRMTGNTEDASDITQEAFIKAYNSLSSFRNDSKFSVWLYRIASNLCTDFLRSKSRKPYQSLTVEDEVGEEAQLDIADDSFSPEVMLERSLTRDAVRRGLDSLPPEHREILLLRELAGMSYDEIANTLSLEAGTVKSRIFRARKKLCAFLLADGNISIPVSSETVGGGEKP